MRNPDQQTGKNKAWVIPIPAPKRPDEAATLVQYLLEVPGANAAWNRWLLLVIHLRDIEGQHRSPHRAFPEATHELLIAALDPDYEYTDEPDFGLCEKGAPFIEPVDVIQQFKVRNDEDAKQLAATCVKAILNGHMSPDSDWRSRWATSIAATAKHIREGAHDNN